MELIEVANAMFKNRDKWEYVSEKDKIDYAFIFNRFLSKKYPEKAFLLNDKNANKVSIMNMWFHFMKNEPYPKWFWSKNKKEVEILSDKDIELLMISLDINKREDIQYLVNNDFEFIKEQLKNLKNKQK